MTDCAWCGGEVFQRFPNRRGEVFCSAYHRRASNEALKAFRVATNPLNCNCYRSVTENRKECDSGPDCPALHAVATRMAAAKRDRASEGQE